MFTAARVFIGLKKSVTRIDAEAFVPEGLMSVSEEKTLVLMTEVVEPQKRQVASLPTLASQQDLQRRFSTSVAEAFHPDHYCPVPDFSASAYRKPVYVRDGKVCVSPFVHDIAIGVNGGVIMAFGTALLTPIDAALARSVVKSGANKTAGTATQPYYSVFTKIFCSTTSVQKLYQGGLYKLAYNLPRNALMFPIMPLVYDNCRNKWEWSPVASKISCGISFGILEAIASAKKEVVATHIYVNGVNAKAAENSISTSQMQVMMANAVKYRAFRSIAYWGAMPLVADIIETQIIYSKYLKSEISEDINAPALIAGLIAGTGASVLSYPFEVAKLKKVNSPGCKILPSIYECLEKHGTFNGPMRVVTEHTHTGFRLAATRVALASALFQWARDRSLKDTSEFLERDVNHDNCGQAPKPGKRA